MGQNFVEELKWRGMLHEVWRGTQEGLNAVIVNPGVVLGAGYWNGGSSGNLFQQIYNGMSFYVKGVVGYVDVFDVVKIMHQLMKSNITNEGYIVISENLSFESFQNKVATSLKVKAPKKEAKNMAAQFDMANGLVTP